MRRWRWVPGFSVRREVFGDQRNVQVELRFRNLRRESVEGEVPDGFDVLKQDIPKKYRYPPQLWELIAPARGIRSQLRTDAMSARTATATDSDTISRRIAEVTKDDGPGHKEAKKVPLTWEEEELAFYEPKREVAVEVKRKADARAAMILHQLPHQWNALREVISIRCESINTKAGRVVLRAIAADKNRLEVRREDDHGFAMLFDPDRKKITFTGKVLGYDREYELIVQTRDDVDTTAWFSSTTLTTEQTDALAKTMISVLMRFEQ
jgi:hypothetical protein